MICRIREVALNKRGWSLCRLAERLGVRPQIVFNWETRSMPCTENLDLICEVLGCTMGELYEPETRKQRGCNKVLPFDKPITDKTKKRGTKRSTLNKGFSRGEYAKMKEEKQEVKQPIIRQSYTLLPAAAAEGVGCIEYR